MSDHPRPLSDWLLEKVAAGDQDAAAAAARARLAGDPDAQARLGALRRSTQEILDAHPPATVAAEIQHRHRQRPPTPTSSTLSSRRLLWLAPVAVAAAAFIVLARPRPSIDPRPDDEQTTIKGSAVKPRLRVYLKVGDDVHRLAEGEPVHPHDTLQVSYVPAGRRFGAVLSIDGSGVVTLHLPEQAGPAPRLSPRPEEVPLPHAYELDAAPGFERFVFVTADRPFDVAEISRALQNGARLPPDLDAVAFPVKKVTP